MKKTAGVAAVTLAMMGLGAPSALSAPLGNANPDVGFRLESGEFLGSFSQGSGNRYAFSADHGLDLADSYPEATAQNVQGADKIGYLLSKHHDNLSYVQAAALDLTISHLSNKANLNNENDPLVQVARQMEADGIRVHNGYDLSCGASGVLVWACGSDESIVDMARAFLADANRNGGSFTIRNNFQQLRFPQQGAPVNAEATVSGSGGPIAGVPVRFNVEGLLGGSQTVTTGSDGKAVNELTFDEPGVYQLSAETQAALPGPSLVASVDGKKTLLVKGSTNELSTSSTRVTVSGANVHQELGVDADGNPEATLDIFTDQPNTDVSIGFFVERSANPVEVTEDLDFGTTQFVEEAWMTARTDEHGAIRNFPVQFDPSVEMGDGYFISQTVVNGPRGLIHQTQWGENGGMFANGSAAYDVEIETTSSARNGIDVGQTVTDEVRLTGMNPGGTYEVESVHYGPFPTKPGVAEDAEADAAEHHSAVTTVTADDNGEATFTVTTPPVVETGWYSWDTEVYAEGTNPGDPGGPVVTVGIRVDQTPIADHGIGQPSETGYARDYRPAVTTEATVPMVKVGDSVTDTVIITDGRANAPVSGKSVLYGPFENETNLSDTVPADAPKVGEGTFGGTLDAEGGARIDTSGVEATEAGYYTWVATLDEETSNGAVLSHGVTDKFGQPSESLVVVDPDATAAVDQNEVEIDVDVTDTGDFEGIVHEVGGTPIVSKYHGALYGPVPAKSDVPKENACHGLDWSNAEKVADIDEFDAVNGLGHELDKYRTTEEGCFSYKGTLRMFHDDNHNGVKDDGEVELSDSTELGEPEQTFRVMGKETTSTPTPSPSPTPSPTPSLIPPITVEAPSPTPTPVTVETPQQSRLDGGEDQSWFGGIESGEPEGVDARVAAGGAAAVLCGVTLAVVALRRRNDG